MVIKKSSATLRIFVYVLLTVPMISFGISCTDGGQASFLIDLPIDKEHYAGAFHCEVTYNTKVTPYLSREVLEDLPVCLENHHVLISGGAFVTGVAWIASGMLNKIYFPYRSDPHEVTKSQENKSLCYRIKRSCICRREKVPEGANKTPNKSSAQSLRKLMPYQNQIIVKCKLGMGKGRVPATDNDLPEWLE